MDAKINSDAAEVAKFDKEANDWWDVKGSAAPLHHLNPARLQFIADRVLLNQKKVLDIGACGGILSESLAKKGAIVTGIDASLSLVEIAKEHAKTNALAIDYHHITAEEFVIDKEGTFDIVTCMELLEHVPDPKSLVQAAAKLLKPNGAIFFSTLNRNIKSYMLAIVGAEYLLRLLPKHTHHYEKFIRPSELHAWCIEASLDPQEFVGLHYNPFTKVAKLNADVSVNYLCFAKPLKK